jgi:hypothetical protein
MKEDDKVFLELTEKFKSDTKLTTKDMEVMERWKFAHDAQTNDFIMGKELEQNLMDRFGVSLRTARYDIANAKKFFITDQQIDKDYWRGLLLSWQIKGLKLAYEANKIKEFNAGIRNLYLILNLHKTDKLVNPKLLQQNVFNFFADPKRIGLPEICEAEIIELVEDMIKDENVTPEQKNKILKDAGIHPDREPRSD